MTEVEKLRKMLRGGVMAPNLLKIERFLLFVTDKAETTALSRIEKMEVNKAYHHAWWYREKILKTLYLERTEPNEIAPFVFPDLKSPAELYLETLLTTYTDMNTNLVIHKHLIKDINKTYDFLSKKTVVSTGVSDTATEEADTPRFPFKIPAGTTWENITMIFTTDNKVEIRVGKHTHSTNFADMGFSDGRKIGKPNMLWALLKLFAMKNGSLPPSDPDANDRYKKQKQLLADHLKEYFAIEYDPFKPYSKTHGYAMKMVIFMEEDTEQDAERSDPNDSLSGESKEMFTMLQGGIEN